VAVVAGLVIVAGCSDRTVASDGGDTGGGSTTASDDGGGDDGGGDDGGNDDGTTTGPDGGSTDTTTDEGDTTSDGWTTGDDGCAFYGACPDVGDIPLECDVWAQDCPEGEKCMPWANDGGDSWNATKCTPLDPDPKQPGETCTVEGSGVSGVDDCELGAMCWDVDPETLEGVCVGLCTGSPIAPICSDPETQCSIYNDALLPLCLAACDPLVQDCPDGDLCIPASGPDGFICILDASGDEGQYGDPCEKVNVCDPGLFCANAESVPDCVSMVGCCTEFCDLTAPDPLAYCSGVADGIECVPWYEPGQAPQGYDHVGACTLPP